jgi:hypothetical protein
MCGKTTPRPAGGAGRAAAGAVGRGGPPRGARPCVGVGVAAAAPNGIPATKAGVPVGGGGAAVAGGGGAPGAGGPGGGGPPRGAPRGAPGAGGGGTAPGGGGTAPGVGGKPGGSAAAAAVAGTGGGGGPGAGVPPPPPGVAPPPPPVGLGVRAGAPNALKGGNGAVAVEGSPPELEDLALTGRKAATATGAGLAVTVRDLAPVVDRDGNVLTAAATGAAAAGAAGAAGADAALMASYKSCSSLSTFAFNVTATSVIKADNYSKVKSSIGNFPELAAPHKSSFSFAYSLSSS